MPEILLKSTTTVASLVGAPLGVALPIEQLMSARVSGGQHCQDVCHQHQGLGTDTRGLGGDNQPAFNTQNSISTSGIINWTV